MCGSNLDRRQLCVWGRSGVLVLVDIENVSRGEMRVVQYRIQVPGETNASFRSIHFQIHTIHLMFSF